MFSIVARSIPRRTLVQSARYFAQKPPSTPPKRKIKSAASPPPPPPPTRKAETATSAEAPPPKAPQTPPPQSQSEPVPEAEEPPVVVASSVPTLDFSPPGAEEEFQQRTGAKSSKGSLSTNERKRRFASRVSLAMMAVGLGLGTLYLGREWGPEELKEKRMKIEDAPSTRWGRTTERFTNLFDFFTKPAWPELLPPPYPPPHQKPYTLLLSVDDLLVTSTWDRQHGWRTAKRPGVDYFLAYISQFYEVVIFTTQPSYTASPIIDKLDRYNFYVMYRLFREATRTLDGKVVKDLSYLNRDLSKVIMIDTHPEHVVTHPENSIIIPEWTGDPKDRDLVAMIPFLESIAIYKPNDVRPILKAYEGKNIPIEYGKVEAEMKAKHVAEWQAKHKNKGSAEFSFSSLFGLSDTPALPKNTAPPTYLEQKRAEAQHQYQQEMKYIKDNHEELERLLEQDQQAMQAQVPGSLWEAVDQLRGVGPPPTGAPGAGATGAAGVAGAAVPAGGAAAGSAAAAAASTSTSTKP